MEPSLTPSCGTANLLVCMCVLDSIPTPFKEALRFPLKLFEKAVKIKWQDKIRDTEVLKKAGAQSMYTVLKLAHAAKMDWPCYKNA